MGVLKKLATEASGYRLRFALTQAHSTWRRVMASNFQDFIARNSVVPVTNLPLVHTTASYRLDGIKTANAIVPTKCDVFETPLSYFFVGRPAYKVHEGDGEAEEWELPCCFIFEYEAVKNPERVFPFDSGAFARKRMPQYVSMMPIDNFNVADTPNAPLKIVGAYFGDAKKYVKGQAKEVSTFQGEFALGVFDAEIKAVHRLALEKHNAKVDDRRLSVELQTAETLDLRVTRPIAVVAPMPYFEDKAFRDHVLNEWKAQPIGYPISSLSSGAYYSAIYERIEKLYKELKLL
ncbi:hypothetical protein [Caulobacter segnis]